MNRLITNTAVSLSLLAATLFSTGNIANDRFANVEIKSTQVNGDVYMLEGFGGNIGVLVGSDGTLMIDDQFEPLAPKIEKAISKLTDTPQIKYVVNTHYHGDHAGGNVYFARSASVLAHMNVRERLAKKGNEGLPVITYEDGVMLHLNNEDVHVKHLPAGHTDGDSVVYFPNANVWHLGDLFFNGRFPFIDTQGGGSVAGYIANIEHLLTKIDDDARIIPGHGPLTDKKGLAKLLAMIVATKVEVDAMKADGKSLEQAIAIGLDKKWQSWDWSFITEEKWITTLYKAG